MATAKASEGVVAVEAETTGGGGLGGAAEPTPATTDTINPTPPQYITGWVKQDPASLAVAVRTNIPDPESNHDWGVMTVDRGGHYAGWDEVAGWSDLHP